MYIGSLRVCPRERRSLQGGYLQDISILENRVADPNPGVLVGYGSVFIIDLRGSDPDPNKVEFVIQNPLKSVIIKLFSSCSYMKYIY